MKRPNHALSLVSLGTATRLMRIIGFALLMFASASCSKPKQRTVTVESSNGTMTCIVRGDFVYIVRSGQPLLKLSAHSNGYQISISSKGDLAAFVELNNDLKCPEAVTVRHHSPDGSEFLTRYDALGATESHPIPKEPLPPKSSR